MRSKKLYLSSTFTVLSILLCLGIFSTNQIPTVTAINYENSFHHSHIQSTGAWEITQGSKEITVAIIDSGIDFGHPDINGSAWINTGEVFNNSIDDDGNGYVDDIYGWDFVSNDSIPGPEIDDPIHWHATFIAGIIAAPKDDLGIVGVAPNVTVMDLRILLSNNYNGVTYEEFGDAIRYAVDNGADVINLSLHYYADSTDYYDDILYAISQNVPVVSVTGNTDLPLGGQEYPSYPGAYDEVISVGATNINKLKADYSNYGSWTDIVAPVGDENSVNIRSCAPPDQYWTGWGTSFAAPQVAAVIALMRSLNHSLTVDEIKHILYESATDLGDPGKDIYFGHGLLNASKAVRAVLDPSILITPTPTDDSSFFAYSTLILFVSSSVIVLKRKRKRV
ncbi:MAG: S8 family serine peptidase [Candidatus Heimdallarchaeota archaeon]|nr:S8 family serine peptidase [Candidatus Heimdallarchaeota archaeon]